MDEEILFRLLSWLRIAITEQKLNRKLNENSIGLWFYNGGIQEK